VFGATHPLTQHHTTDDLTPKHMRLNFSENVYVRIKSLMQHRLTFSCKPQSFLVISSDTWYALIFQHGMC